MTVQELINRDIFDVINVGNNTEMSVTASFCCDLLSIAMSKAPAACAWTTVMGNINTLAVAELADVACIILAEGMQLDDSALKKAKVQNITVLGTNNHIFETALAVHSMIHE